MNAVAAGCISFSINTLSSSDLGSFLIAKVEIATSEHESDAVCMAIYPLRLIPSSFRKSTSKAKFSRQKMNCRSNINSQSLRTK